MKKHKKSIIIVSIVLFAAAITAAAAGTYGALTQPQKQQPGVQLTAQRSAAVGELTDPIYTYLANHYAGEELYEKVEAYARMKIVYQPTQTEIGKLADLLDNGTDFDAVLTSYKFWTTTNADISLLEQIAGTYTADMEQMMNWVDNVYDSLKGKSGLTVQEVKEYQEKELTREDILLADELSRKDVYTIKEILSKREQGKDWFTIISDVYSGINIPLNLPTSKKAAYQAIEDGDSILQAVFLSTRSNQTLEQWMDLLVQGTDTFRDTVTTYHTDLVCDELKRLKAAGLYALTGEEAIAQESQEQFLMQQLEAQQVDMQQVEVLQTEGYDTAEILNAASEAKYTGRSIAEELEQ
ncbi:MAG: hypothetical protein HFI90_12400 [Clostridia bacterium]|nr:hypothetical protein [Clostridia bacterium]